jgi:hypothetical protein
MAAEEKHLLGIEKPTSDGRAERKVLAVAVCRQKSDAGVVVKGDGHLILVPQRCRRARWAD